MSFRAGFVGLIGLPNSGKSTLLNAVVGEHVSIVSPKPQTTRRRVMGLWNTENFQAVLVDAPGIVKSKAGLFQFLHEECSDIVNQSDVLVVVLNVDASSFEELQEVVQMARHSGKPWLAIIHKIDLPEAHRPVILHQYLRELNVPVIQGSALKDPEVLKERLMEELPALLPDAPGPLYDRELFTLSTMRELAAELIREKAFLNLYQEIPFGLAVRILKFDEDSGPVVKIFAEIMVNKENHRPIVIGEGGRMLKRIGTEARKDIERLMDRKVYLGLKVSVKRNWAKNPGLMKELNYVVPKS